MATTSHTAAARGCAPASAACRRTSIVCRNHQREYRARPDRQGPRPHRRGCQSSSVRTTSSSACRRVIIRFWASTAVASVDGPAPAPLHRPCGGARSAHSGFRRGDERPRPATEERLLRQLKANARGRTVIMITHAWRRWPSPTVSPWSWKAASSASARRARSWPMRVYAGWPKRAQGGQHARRRLQRPRVGLSRCAPRRMERAVRVQPISTNSGSASLASRSDASRAQSTSKALCVSLRPPVVGAVGAGSRRHRVGNDQPTSAGMSACGKSIGTATYS